MPDESATLTKIRIVSNSIPAMFRVLPRASISPFRGIACRPTQLLLRFNSSKAAPKGNVKEISDLTQFKDFVKPDKLTVIDFYATWCGPCKALEPIFAMLSDKIPEVSFGRVDVDKATDVAQEYQISAMPTCLFFQNGLKIDTIVGANPPRLVELIAEHGKVDLKNR